LRRRQPRDGEGGERRSSPQIEFFATSRDGIAGEGDNNEEAGVSNDDASTMRTREGGDVDVDATNDAITLGRRGKQSWRRGAGSAARMGAVL
jgi:hypothetical protein